MTDQATKTAARVVQDEEDPEDFVDALSHDVDDDDNEEKALLANTLRWMKLSYDEQAAASSFLEAMGCSTLSHLFILQKTDLEKSSLRPATQRMLFMIAEYLELFGTEELTAWITRNLPLPLMVAKVRRAKASTTSTRTAESSRENGTSENDKNVINVCVGGHKFTTTRTTLCRVPGSALEAIFSERHGKSALRNKDGDYIIDRDGTHFQYVLQFLRVGAVVSLPQDTHGRAELAVEADFYGLDELVRAIKSPIIEVDDYLPSEVQKIRADEEAIRKKFRKKRAQELELHQGLIPLFDPEQGLDYTLKYQPLDTKPEELLPVLGARKSTGEPGTPVCVESLGRFRYYFNRDYADVLNRLNDALLTEPIVIAGGSVLSALTAGPEVRTKEWSSAQGGDIDIFIHTRDTAEAIRIAQRVFFSLAVDLERWAVVRSKGVINLFRWVNWEIDTKIQIILRLYESPAEVLYGFDCDSCGCCYDGRNVWVSPRWVYSLSHGVNMLNPLHSWPNKPAYELRLAKYAYRGFPVLVPGLESNQVDLRYIHTNCLSSLKGLARLIKIFLEMEAVPRHSTESVLRLPKNVDTIRDSILSDLSGGELIAKGMGGYDELVDSAIVPLVYGEAATDGLAWYFGDHNDFPIARECREQAWSDIVNAEDEVAAEGVPNQLTDAWDLGQRSREYLNASMDKSDLDHIYYIHAYGKEDGDLESS